jgi:hypothetical protein
LKRVIVLPLSEAAQFPDLEVIARDRDLAVFVGNTTPGRTREAYESDESFLDAVAHGWADRYTFKTLDEAATFAKQRLEELVRAARKIEDALTMKGAQRHQPKKDKGGLLRVVQKKKKA